MEFKSLLGLVVAPPRLSSTICCPRRCDKAGWIVRETMSVPPPGGNGTITRIGRSG